ncbi:MurR/RpiR family transcriptional regulator [Gulosibacter faecalis]|uniref:MurR/RpiR family transcriptional regulator n=1 Tax=Gulosibacter faecalis TaxID=272240 RepID=A0ABW5UZN7_9MICO|nr:MurR/RpiR family transcriptional regulator [Gulosibacter faecalis]
MTTPATHDDAASVTERINGRFADLTSAERRVARTLLSDYPVAGLTSVHRFAERAGVSAATIVRFVQTLGFAAYREFQDSLRDEVQAREDSALSLALRRPDPAPADDGLEQLRASQASYIDGINRTFDSLRASEVEQLVGWLADSRVGIVAHGGVFSGLLAHHLVTELSMFRPGVRTCPSNTMRQIDLLLESANRADVWVIFDFRRYAPATERIARQAREHGARIALITDRWLSPIANFADVVLSCRVEASGPSDTLVPAMALVSALCEAAVARLGSDGLDRLRRIDPMRAAIESTITKEPL